MTMLEEFVKERNEALFSLDRNKIEAYMKKYAENRQPLRFLRQKQNEKHGLLWPCFDGTRSSVICA